MASFRFVHTADIHLDSPLKGLAGHDGSAAEKIRTATRQAFENLVSQAISEKVAFMIIAGDLYDGDWRNYQTGLFFTRQMGRLAKAGIPVFIALGNHDAESQITRSLPLPDNVKTFASRKPNSFSLEQLDVVLHGQSFRQRDISDNLVPGYPAPVNGRFNIGVLHTGLGGMGGHANYAPCSIEDLTSKGYDYWALGHVHQGKVLHERPHVVFPGNLQARHINEEGRKSASLITVEDFEIVEIAPLYADVVRWARLSVSIQGCSHISDLMECVGQALKKAIADESDGRLLACRIELSGRTTMHEKLLSFPEQIQAEARALALGLGEDLAWIEKVVVSTNPAVAMDGTAGREDAFGDLQRILGEAATDSALLERLKSEIGDFILKLPHEVRDEAEDPILKSATEKDLSGLIALMSDYVPARISVGGK